MRTIVVSKVELFALLIVSFIALQPPIYARYTGLVYKDKVTLDLILVEYFFCLFVCLFLIYVVQITMTKGAQCGFVSYYLLAIEIIIYYVINNK